MRPRALLAPLAAAAAALLAASMAQPARGETVTLSPAAVPLRGGFGQSARQTLTLTNATAVEMSFTLEARDVVVREGRRQFVAAGELPGSIAATAVFSRGSVAVPAGGSASVDVTLTVPPGTPLRAVVALFRGTTLLRGRATASLGTLLTFALSENVSVAPAPLVVFPQTAVRNATFEQSLTNDGTEPVVARGTAVLLGDGGALVGRVPFEPRRLLPGERVALTAEYGSELPAGRYTALATIEVEDRALNRSAVLVVP